MGTQKRHAVATALAASSLPPLVMARGHRIGEVAELPLVVSDGLDSVTKTKQAVEALKKIGAGEDMQKVLDSKKLRAGQDTKPPLPHALWAPGHLQRGQRHQTCHAQHSW